jgi:acyl-CoA thioester hydrolase
MMPEASRDGDRAPPGRDAFRFWTQEKLRNPDTDQFGHVNNAAMASFFEAGRMELFAGRPAAAAKLQLVVARLLMNFHKELYYPGEVSIGSIVTRVGRSSFDVAQGLFAGDDCIASAQATCVAFDAEQRRPTEIPGPLRDYLSGSRARSDP